MSRTDLYVTDLHHVDINSVHIGDEYRVIGLDLNNYIVRLSSVEPTVVKEPTPVMVEEPKPKPVRRRMAKENGEDANG